MPRKKVVEDPKKVIKPATKRRSKISGPANIESLTNIPTKCGFCPYKVRSLDDYGAHVVKKHLDQLQLCPKCSRAFICDNELEEHQAKHTERHKSVSCALCVIHCNSVALLERHDAAKHRAAGPGVCLAPLLQYLSCHLHTSFVKFVRAIHKGSIVCQVCKCEYSIPNYKYHLRRCGGTAYACDVCVEVHSEKRQLSKHYKSKVCKASDVSLLPNASNASSKSVKCAKCTLSFSRDSFLLHTRVCKVFRCEPCRISFDGIDAYNQHYVLNHKESLKVKTCPHCPMEFIKTELYEKHVKQHEKYKCVSCNKLFRTPKPLLLHLKSHKDVSPYVCQLCDLNFKEGVDFKEHIIQHRNEGCVNFNENGHIAYSRPKPKAKTADNVKASSSSHGGKDAKSGPTEKMGESGVTLQTVVEAERTNGEEGGKQKNYREESEISAATLSEILQNKTQEESAADVLQDDIEADTDKETNVASNREIADNEAARANQIDTDDNAEKSAKTMILRKSKRAAAMKSKVKIVLRKRRKVAEESEDSDDEPLIKKRKTRVKRTPAKQAYKCPLCRKGMRGLNFFNRHMHQHFKAGAKQCMRCAKIFASASGRDNHYKECKKAQKPMNKLHQYLKERARQKLEKLRSRPPVPRPKPVLPPPPPPLPFRIVLKKVAAPTYDAIQNGTFNIMNVKGVKVTEFFGKIPKNKIGDLTARNYIENFQPEEAINETKQFQTKNPTIKPLTNSRNLKIRSVRSVIATKMFKVRSKRFRVPPVVELRPGILPPRPFKETRKEKVKVTVNVVVNCAGAAPRLDYGERQPTCEAEEPADYGEYMQEDDDNVAQDVEVSSEPLYPRKRVVQNHKTGGRFKVEVSAGEPSTEEIETKLAEVCKRLDVPVEKTSLHIGRLTTAAPYFQIVNVKQVLKKQKELKKQESMKQRFQKVKIGDSKMVPVNPLAHLMPKMDKPVNRVIDVTPID